jgi:uncharacterized membrane protein
VTDNRLRVAILALAAVGAGIAGYLLYERWTGGAPVCGTGGCEIVQNSKYAKIAGVPVALLGLIAYLAIFVAALSRSEPARVAGAAIALGGLVFAVYLIYVQAALIDAFCQWCLASDVIIALLALMTSLRLVRTAAVEQPA